MTDDSRDQRSILVFSNWAVLGFVGLALLLEGFSRDLYLIGAAGIVFIVAGFAGHIILNGIFATGFAPGETALGLTAFGVTVLLFIAGWFSAEVSQTDYFIAITLFAALILGFFVYVATRHGLRSAFSRFHHKQLPAQPGRDG